MKHTIRFIFLLLTLVIVGASNIWALDSKDIIIGFVLPNSSAGQVEKAVSDRTVTITVTPASGYKTRKSLIIVEKMVNPGGLSTQSRSNIGQFNLTGTDDWITSETEYTFTIPAEYDGAFITATFVSTSANVITSLSEITDLTANYELAADIDASGFTSKGEFTGTLDGKFHKIYNLSEPLFTSTNGAIIRNITFEGVNINVTTGNVGAVTGDAKGATRIYNCGILPAYTEYDAEGNVTGFSGCSISSTSSTSCIGGLVGKLYDTSRVINCYSYANISGGSNAAGIVGYNNVATTKTDLKTMVMNCMFYGNITSATTMKPVYGGYKISNAGENGVNGYNYYRNGDDVTFDDNYTSFDDYYCTLPADEEYLTRFEYYRSILNSNKKLCAWWINGTSGTAPTDAEVEEVGIAKWVLDPSIAPYPILKKWGKYPSVINQDLENVWNPKTQQKINREMAEPYQGKRLGTISVTVNAGPQHAGTGATSTTLSSVVVLDMDTLNHDYSYAKIQLPYYNELFGDPSVEIPDPSAEDYGSKWNQRYGGNYKDYVVTGWKITAVSGGTTGSFKGYAVSANGSVSSGAVTPDVTSATAWEDGFNFADRKCTNKDLYSKSGRVFAQGGYYYVPEGVTSITIEAYWGKAVYLHNKEHSIDRVNVAQGADGAADAEFGTAFSPAGTLSNTFQDQTVQTTLQEAIGQLTKNPALTVFDQAIVLIGNVQVKNRNASVGDNTVANRRPFTIMSIDEDMDNEPDYCLEFQYRQKTDRLPIHPIRFDFLPVPELGLVMRTNQRAYAIGVFIPTGHFEITETSFMHTTQFEYDGDVNRVESPIILNGGHFEQIVVRYGPKDKVNYFLLGGHFRMKRFTPGYHASNVKGGNVRHCAVNAIGGDYPEFYLSGIYQPNLNINSDNPHCYVNGGRFGTLAGAGYEQIDGNVTFKIDHAIIDNFYGGGLNGAKPVTGSIDVTINNSIVNDVYCGGPKVGTMTKPEGEARKTVTTTAENTIFNKYFGGGNGGTSYYREQQYDNDVAWPSDANWLSDTYKFPAFNPLNFSDSKKYDANKGYHDQFEFEVFNSSNGLNFNAVIRTIYVWAQFGTTITGTVTNTLNNCIIENNFYGGGSLGNVDGDVVSTLNNTQVKGSVFGGGYSAEIPRFRVHDKSKVHIPHRNNSGVIDEQGYLEYLQDDGVDRYYRWTNDNNGGAATTNKPTYWSETDNEFKCYTPISLAGLGEVSGNVTLTINGNTVADEDGKMMTVGESVYGGGEESGIAGNTTVTVNGGKIGVGSTGKFGYRWGNVYGGGKGKIKVKEDGSSELTVSSVADLDAGYVKGNTNITINGGYILHNVYGGGAVGSVGDFARDNTTGMPTACAANTGLATVKVFGGTIGHDHVDTGMVNGSSRGWEGDPEGTGAFAFLNQLAWINNSDVIIGDPESDGENPGPSIWGSVFGGGENGHNFEDGRVTVNKGTIGDREGTWDCGNVYGAGCGTDTFSRDDDGDGEIDDNEKKHYNPMAGIVRRATYVTINGGHVLRNVYGGGSMGCVGTITSSTKHESLTDGFGLSWPYEFVYDTYIDTEDGNKEKKTGKTTVTINGGRIGTTGEDGYGYVYGAAKGTVDVGENNIHKQRYVEALLANVRETEVIINYPSTPDADDVVTIDEGTSATVIEDNNIPCITGAVFGGGEDGHVYEDANIKIRKGLIGNSVYGGGRGKSTYRGILKKLDETEYETDISSWIAGKVYGNVTIEMTGGHVVRNIYGGGNLGSVGKGNYSSGADDYYPAGYGETLEGNLWTTSATEENPDNAWHFLNSGKITVKVQGGTVGMENGVQDGMPVGCIFGSSRGRAAADVGNKSPRYEYAPDFYLGYANETEVEIGEDGEEEGPTIWGSVYGGGRDGHVRRHTKVTVFGGTIGKECTSSSIISYNDVQWRDRGNVYGSGSGMGLYDSDHDGTADKHGTSSGSVTGWTQVFIKGGTIYQNVYGGGALSSVGAPKLNQTSEEYRKGDTAEGHGIGKQTICEVNIEGGTIGNLAGLNKNYGGYVFAAGRGGGLVTGELQEDYATSVWTEVNVKPHASDPTKNPIIWGSVYGGGEMGLVKCGVNVNITGGEIKNDVYGGGAKAHTNTSNWTYDKTNKQWGTTWASDEKSTKYTTTVKLIGGKIIRNVYGGGLGQTADAGKGLEDVEAMVYGDVLVDLNNDADVHDEDMGCVVLGSIFGCNNLNGTPKGDVMVHVYKTQNKDATRITNDPSAEPAVTNAKVTNRYDVIAVYGGGNQSAYVPADLTGVNKTEVIIDGCERTSIKQVYGGGNASSTPATNVTVNGTFEIEELFGGGNGRDVIQINGVTMPNPGANVGYKDYSEYYKEDGVWKVRDKEAYDTKEKRAAATEIIYGTGKASVTIYGGTVHRVFGGSNTKGNVRQTAVTLLDEEGECPFCVDEAYGGGKSAEMDAEAQLLLACIPGLQAVYGGAEAADVRGNVTLNITNGTFDRVFGGNNLSGTIGGSITVNVEEIGCKPVKIGELYGGGNQAAYSIYGYNDDGTPKTSGSNPYKDPEVNVMSFTSIGNIYGGGYGGGATMVGNPTVNVNVAYGRYYNDDVSIVGEGAETPNHYPIPSHAKGKMGAINNVFGGGNAAKVMGNTTVNVATLAVVYVIKQVTPNATLPEGCYTRSGAGTTADPYVYLAATGTAVDGVTYYEQKDVLGADIRGDVFGGGNEAEVTGNANVTVGR